MNPNKLQFMVKQALQQPVSVESFGIESAEVDLSDLQIAEGDVSVEGIFDTIASWFRPETDFHKVTDLINSANFRKIETVARRTILNGKWLQNVQLNVGPVKDASSIASRLAYDGVWVQHSALPNILKYINEYDRVCAQYWKAVEGYYDLFNRISQQMDQHRKNMRELVERGEMLHGVYEQVAAELIRSIADSHRRLQRIEHPSEAAKRIFRGFTMLGPKATIEVKEGERISDVEYVLLEDASADAPVECMTETQLMEAGAILVKQLRDVRSWFFITFGAAVEKESQIDDFNDMLKFVIPYASRSEIEMIGEFKQMAEEKQARLWPKEIPNEYTIIKGLIYWIRETLPRNAI